MNDRLRNIVTTVLRLVPAGFFIGIVALFGFWDSSSASDGFISIHNATHILNQTAPVGILAIGMTFVLLTAGIDLSVGSIMYLSVVVFGLYASEVSIPVALVITASVGAAIGLLNASAVVILRVAPFIVTLASMSMLRGCGRMLTETKQVYMSESTREFGLSSFVGVPWPIWILAVVALTSWVVLSQTGFGRHIYAVGEHPDAAIKAGIHRGAILFSVYAICGLCAGIAGLVAVSQYGAASTEFGGGMEFQAIAAAVLGGTSLFGGRGSVGGTLFGAVLVNTVNSGLNSIDADPYVYPLITASIIFAAVLIDSYRNHIISQLNRPRIRVESNAGSPTTPAKN